MHPVHPRHPQVLMFSATLHSPEVRGLAEKICQNPVVVDLKGKDAVPEAGECWLGAGRGGGRHPANGPQGQ